MLSRVFGRGSIYETLDFDDRRLDNHNNHRNDADDNAYPLYESSALYDDPVDSRHEALPLHNRAGYPAVPRATTAHHHVSNSHYPHYENTLPNLNEEEANDDVPGSLLVEEQHQPRQDNPAQEQAYYEPFDATREQDLDNLERGVRSPPARGGARTPDPTVWLGLVDPKERALWKWANVENLDVFLQQVPNTLTYITP
jgi:hypothetical protein